ncbi:MAG: hypothetical protein A2580_07840 [Hydrogenophilales bacterium RIFOXYD1_FULL_62_11]|nr:MAG: hypothetical protein A2580_07840 [Hydrogenophilales bacterium RIFOXYD1_FULL_62_11]
MNASGPRAGLLQPARALAQSKERQDCDDDDDSTDDVDDVIHEIPLREFKNGPEVDVRFFAHPPKQYPVQSSAAVSAHTVNLSDYRSPG